MKTIVNKLIIILFAFCVYSNLIIAQTSTYLDGNSYEVSLIPQSPDIISSSWLKDTFIFDSGEMYCAMMKKREGFKAAPYNPTISSSDESANVKFAYEGFSKYGSTLRIEGTAKGNLIEGTAEWTDDNGLHTYTFTGTLL